MPLLVTVTLLLAFVMLAEHAQEIARVLSGRILMCLQTLIPSLFGCMALSNLLMGSGAADWLGGRLAPLCTLLRMPPAALSIFLISQIAGYPVGALLLRRAAGSGSLTEQDAARLSCVCFGCGPAFAVGLAGVQLFGSPCIGWALLLSCCTANLLLALLLKRVGSPTPPDSPCVRLRAAELTDAVSAAMRSLAQICGMVLLFGILLCLAELLGITALLVRLGEAAGVPAQTVRALTAAAADITQLAALCRCGLPAGVLLPLTAALLSFGGICVHWQCLALGVSGMSPLRLLLLRLAAALAAAAVMRMLLPLLPLSDAAAVFAHRTAVSETGSVLPALLIVCSGFPLLLPQQHPLPHTG